MRPNMARYARDTTARTLAEVLKGTDIFLGLSAPRVLKPEWLPLFAEKPLILALANPDPEIAPDAVRAARPDAIVATGRSDYPNQVNNVLGFPYIFRGALDVRAREINEPMKRAASEALAALAKEDVPDSVLKAYNLPALRFGRDYLIPKPFDYRVLYWVAPAVAKAAMDSGVARVEIDLDAYRRKLEVLLSRTREVMRAVREKARAHPKRIVFPEGEHPKVLRAAKILAESGICRPVLLARPEQVAPRIKEFGIPAGKIDFVDIARFPRLDEYADRFAHLRERRGVTREDARQKVLHRNVFGALMVEMGEADGLISGLTNTYSETIRPALQIVGIEPGVRRVSGLYILILKDRVFFFADTTVNIDPSAEDLAEIALLSAATAERFGFEPRVAMISFSNFG
ncbi:MAG TPA: phosphate acyltransferase, partial [Usitatibacter sp.]|nr:phosphate acyltransferase [Usitatibacter sp.]